MRIKIVIGSLVVFANLNASQTAELIWEHLPLSSTAELWGEEIYFYIKPKIGLETEYAREAVEVGDIAYWPSGPCMCLFFGPTPISRDGKITPASAVNVFGKIEGDPGVLARVKDGKVITVTRDTA